MLSALTWHIGLSLSHYRNVFSLHFVYKYFYGNCSDELSSLISRPHEFKRGTRLSIRSHNFCVETARWNRKFYSISLLSWTSRLQSYLPASCVHVMFLKDLNATPIAIFCLLESCSFIVFSSPFSFILNHILHLSVVIVLLGVKW